MEELEKLYQSLTRDGYYTKSFEEFQKQSQDPEYQKKVFDVVSRDGLFTKSQEEFTNKYFPNVSSQGVEPVGKPVASESASASESGSSLSGLPTETSEPTPQAEVEQEDVFIMSPQQASTAPIGDVKKSIDAARKFYGADLNQALVKEGMVIPSKRSQEFNELVDIYNSKIINGEGTSNDRYELAQTKTANEYISSLLDQGIVTEEEVKDLTSLNEIYKLVADKKSMVEGVGAWADTPRTFGTEMQAPQGKDYIVNSIIKEQNKEYHDLLAKNILETIPPEQRTTDNLEKIEQELFEENDIIVDLTGEGRVGEGQNVFKNFALKTQKGLEDVAMTIGAYNASVSPSMWMTGKPIGALGIDYANKFRKEELDRLEKKITQYDSNMTELLSKGNYMGAIDLGLQTTGESVAPMAVAAAVSFATGNPLAGYAAISAYSGGQRYLDVKDEPWFQALSPWGKLAYNTVYGTSEGLTEAVGARIAGRLVKGLLIGDDAANRGLKEYLKEFAKIQGLNVIEEVPTEVVTGITQMISEKVAKGEEITMKDINETAIESGLGALFMTGAIGSLGTLKIPLAAANSLKVKKANKAAKEAIDDINNAQTPEEKVILSEKLMQIEDVRNSLISSEGERLKQFSDEDLNTYTEKVAEFNRLQSQLDALPEGSKAAEVIQERMQNVVNDITAINDKYEGQQKKKTQESEILESLDRDTSLSKISKGEALNENEAARSQEKILSIIDGLDAKQDAELIELLEDEFQRIEDYDKKTRTVTEEVVERRPLGSPKRIDKVKERKASEKVETLLENSRVETGSETEGEVSVIELDDDGNIVISRYNEKSGTKDDAETLQTGKKPSEVEFVESVFDDDGNVVGVKLRITEPKGEQDSPVEFTVVKRNEEDERPLDIAIASAKNQLGEIPQIEFEQAYETVTRQTTKEVPLKKDSNAIQEQETNEVPLRQQADISEEVGEEVRSAQKETRGTPESQVQERVKNAEARLSDTFSKWKASQKNVGVVFDPKSNAKQDIELLKALREYVFAKLAEGAYNAKQFAKDIAAKGLQISNPEDVYKAIVGGISKTKKKSISSKQRAITRKAKKGAYTNAQQEVGELLGLPLHRINNPDLADEVDNLLKDINNQKVRKDKIADVTQRVREDLNLSESGMNPNDFTPKRLSDRIKKLGDRVLNITDDDFTKDALRSARSRFTRVLNDLRILENINNILYDQAQSTGNKAQIDEARVLFEKNKAEVDAARKLLGDIAKSAEQNIQLTLGILNDDNETNSKKIKPEEVTDDPMLEEQVRSFVEAVEGFTTDDISIATEIADIMEDLLYGYIPVGKMSEMTNYINAQIAIESPGMKKASDNINSLPKESSNFIKSLFQMFSPIPKAAADFREWVKKFRNQEFWNWENILGVNKESPIYEILNAVVTQGEVYAEAVATEMAEFRKALKLPVFGKNLKGSALARAMKNYSQDIGSAKNRRSRIMVGMLMIERRFQALYGTSFWNNVMSDKNMLNRLKGKPDKITGVSERTLYQEAFDALPKNEDGSIDIEAATKQIKSDPKQNELFTFLEEKFKKDGALAQKQAIANQKRGLPTDFEDFYFPFLRRGDTSQDKKEFDFSDFFSSINPKIASDRGKEIKDPSFSMMEADPLIAYSDYIHQVNRDYYLTDAIRTAYKMFNGAIKISEGEAKTVFAAMKEALKFNVAWAFRPSERSITDYLLQASYAYYLTTAYRAVAEPTSEMIRSIGAGEVNSRMLKDAYNSGTSFIKDMFARIQGLTIDEKGEIKTTKEFRSNFKKLLTAVNSPFSRQFSRQFSDGSIRTNASSRSNVFENTSNMIMGLPNRATLFALWMPAFNNRYKKLTGKEFDYNKLDDPQFLKDNREVIRKAGAYADKRTAQYKGYSTALGGRTMNKALIIPFLASYNVDALKKPELFKINQFLGSFGWRDSENIKQGIQDIALNFADKFTKEDLKRYSSQSTGEALRNITALITSGVSYPVIMTLLTYLSIKDDDEEDRADWENELVKEIDEKGIFNPETIAKETLGYTVFLSTSKYGYSSRAIALVILGIIQNNLLKQKSLAKTKEGKDRIQSLIDDIDGSTKAYLYTEPINLSGSGRWGSATPAVDVLKMIPGYGLPMQFSDDLQRSVMQYQETLAKGNDRQQQIALGLMSADLLKTALLFGGGGVVPAGKELDKILIGEKIELRKEVKGGKDDDPVKKFLNQKSKNGGGDAASEFVKNLSKK